MQPESCRDVPGGGAGGTGAGSPALTAETGVGLRHGDTSLPVPYSPVDRSTICRSNLRAPGAIWPIDGVP